MSEFTTKLKPHPAQWILFSEVLESVQKRLEETNNDPDLADRISIKMVIQKQFEVLYGRDD